MSKLRVVFMGTPDFAVSCLDILIKNQYDVVGVVTQPDRRRGRGQKMGYSPVKELALANDLTILQPEKIKTPEMVEQIGLLKPDLIIVVAFGQLLPKSLLEIPPLGCINVHASLLPRYRGSAPIHWAIMRGEAMTGVTTMYMDVGMDTGDMILKKTVPIMHEDNTGVLHDKLQVLGAELLLETVRKVEMGTAPRTPQNNVEATYAPLLTRELERIDWTTSAQEIHDKVRGLNPWPGAYCLYQDKILKIWQTSLVDADQKTTSPGSIFKHQDGGLLVETGRGILSVNEVQFQCKRRMGALECACGHCLNVGDFFE